MLALVRAGECDVAIGSRFLPESGQYGERYRPAPERVVGTSLLRLLMRLRLGQPITDGTSGLYAVNRALELLADPYVCESPRSRHWCASPTRSCACWRCPCTCASASTASRRSRAGGRWGWWRRSGSRCLRESCCAAVIRAAAGRLAPAPAARLTRHEPAALAELGPCPLRRAGARGRCRVARRAPARAGCPAADRDGAGQ